MRAVHVSTALGIAEASLEQLRERRKWLLAEISDVELEIEGLRRAIKRGCSSNPPENGSTLQRYDGSEGGSDV